MASGSAGLDGEQGSRRGLALSTIFDIGRGISAMNPALPTRALAGGDEKCREAVTARREPEFSVVNFRLTGDHQPLRGGEASDGAFCDGADVIPWQ